MLWSHLQWERVESENDYEPFLWVRFDHVTYAIPDSPDGWNFYTLMGKYTADHHDGRTEYYNEERGYDRCKPWVTIPAWAICGDCGAKKQHNGDYLCRGCREPSL